MATSTRLSGATVLTMMPDASPSPLEVRIEGRHISHVGPTVPDADVTVDLAGGLLLPGFVQIHVHLCQSLFRNLADDLSLIDWLRQRIWPMEGALEAADMRASADLGLAELIRGGTTTVLDMGSVHHTDAIAEAVVAAGSRAYLGKAMMDRGEEVPASLRETTRDSLRDAEELADRWHGGADGRIGYAMAPRFGPSCSPELLNSVSALCRERGLLLHTHCAESTDEIDLVRREHGVGNLEYLDNCGLTGQRSVFAHMVHLDDRDVALVRRTGTAVAHCPSSNCKLASGFAPIPRYLAEGITVGLGADGAPCNNTLDAFVEMRLAALIHKPRFGAESMPARTVVELATIGGARALGAEDQLGTIEPGKTADIVHLRLDQPFNGVVGDPFGQIVYTASRENVRDVWCDGQRLVAEGELTTLDAEATVARGREAANRVLSRI